MLGCLYGGVLVQRNGGVIVKCCDGALVRGHQETRKRDNNNVLGKTLRIRDGAGEQTVGEDGERTSNGAE